MSSQSTAVQFNDIATAGSNVTNLDVAGLAGDTDGDYEIMGEIICSANAQVLDLQPNALSTNQIFKSFTSEGISAPTSPATDDGTELFIGSTDTSGAHVYFQGRLWSKSGRTRLWTCSTYVDQTTDYKVDISGIWTGTGTAITSLRVLSSHASGILTGSYIRVRRLRNQT